MVWLFKKKKTIKEFGKNNSILRTLVSKFNSDANQHFLLSESKIYIKHFELSYI